VHCVDLIFYSGSYTSAAGQMPQRMWHGLKALDHVHCAYRATHV
jgi:hypothetical protein